MKNIGYSLTNTCKRIGATSVQQQVNPHLLNTSMEVGYVNKTLRKDVLMTPNKTSVCFLN